MPHDDDELPEGTSAQYATAFCRTLKNLALDLTTEFPDDANTARAQKRIILAINEFPVWIVSDVGKGVWKYREQIENHDTEFFLKSKFDEERRRAFEEDPEKGKLTDYLIPMVKKAWRQAGAAKQKKYLDRLLDLLDNYIDYVSLARAGR